MSKARVPLSVGFPPIADERARLLVLGSLPGRKSLEQRQYYAQPYNAFWRIMGALFDAGPEHDYELRLERLRERGVAVWDVLAAGERAGSLDAAIVSASIVVNDFSAFFEHHRRIRSIYFNGNTAAALFRRRVVPTLAPEWAALEMHALPSTSPAYASLKFEKKLERWRAVLGALAT